jgi:hypothetical protein
MFNRGFAALSALFVVVVVASVQPAGAISKYYSNRAIRSLFPGTFEARIDGGRRVLFKASYNGVLRAKLAIGLTDKGRWSVRRNKLCLSLKNWTDGKLYCSYVWKANGWYVVSGLGQQTILFKRAKR